MSFILSALIFLTPIWNLDLKPIKISPKIQELLILEKSLDDMYLVLTFKEAKEVSIFKNEALAGAKKLELCYSLVGTLEAQVKSLRRALGSKDIQTSLLRKQVRSLREAYRSQETNWSIGLIIVSAAAAGYMTYEIVSR